jgi:hypothetical protein
MVEMLSIPLEQATLKVSAEVFNIIIAGLKQLPYVVSQPVIDQLRADVKAQLGET